MEKVAIYYNKDSDTMDIWFGNPEDEYVSEEAGQEAGEELILKKDKDGKIIGIEKLYIVKTLGIRQPLPVELVVS